MTITFIGKDQIMIRNNTIVDIIAHLIQIVRSIIGLIHPSAVLPIVYFTVGWMPNRKIRIVMFIAYIKPAFVAKRNVVHVKKH